MFEGSLSKVKWTNIIDESNVTYVLQRLWIFMRLIIIIITTTVFW